jgi:hypothetical protein
MIRKRIRAYKIGERGNVKSWHNALEGVPAFLIGNSPEVENLDLSVLKHHFAIGINRTFLKFDPTILMWQDAELWWSHKAEISRLKAIKFCRDVADPKNNYYHFKLTPGGFELPRHPAVLHGRGATGPLAFQLAYALGCDPIVLIGMECRYSMGRTNFYGKNPSHKPHTLCNCNRGLKWIKRCGSGRMVINCSHNAVFSEYFDLDDVLARQDVASKTSGRDSLVARLTGAKSRL